MTQWLTDTLIYTGVLIALVLLVRRPVARHFGPQVAYALWALPFLRLIMPPLVLPASLAPAEPEVAVEPMMIILSEATANAAESAAPALAEPVGIALVDLLLPFWIGGAAIFLVWRGRDYLAMRRDLLADARPMGEAGNVRLVETPAVDSPVAFGISDKVIALPPDFMAHHDIAARDMAIAHELAHHRGYDLVANVAAQPLLALHWFNPLAWWGWRAMRRDQEAACDARVVAGRARSERAAYAEVIAGFAAGPNLVMAAPMACPVLGEKSIIHRLRSLTMSEIPSGRKKLGIAAIVTTALVALPVTASISYAQEDAPPVPEAPAAPLPPAAPAAPLPPEAPEPPTIETIDPDGAHRIIRVEVDGEEGEGMRRRMIIRRHGEDGEHGDHAFISEEEFAEVMAEMEAARAEMREADAEMRRAFAEARIVEFELRREEAEARRNGSRARAMAPAVEFGCDGEETNIVRHLEGEDGRQVMIICETAAHNQAAFGLRQAKSAIAADPSLSDEQRETILEELEDALEELEKMKGSLSRMTKLPRVPEAPAVRFEARVNVPAAPALPAVRLQWPVSNYAAPADEDCEEAGEETGFTA